MEHTTSEPESKATPGREKIEQDYGVLCIWLVLSKYASPYLVSKWDCFSSRTN
jgi:hypothetical protein